MIGRLLGCYGYRLCMGGECLPGAPPKSVGGSSRVILRWGVIGRGQGGCLTPPSPPTQLSWKLSSTLLPIAPSPFSNKKEDFSLSG